MQWMIEVEGNQTLFEERVRLLLVELFVTGQVTRVKMGQIHDTPVRFALPVEVTKP